MWPRQEIAKLSTIGWQGEGQNLLKDFLEPQLHPFIPLPPCPRLQTLSTATAVRLAAAEGCSS